MFNKSNMNNFKIFISKFNDVTLHYLTPLPTASLTFLYPFSASNFANSVLILVTTGGPW